MDTPAKVLKIETQISQIQFRDNQRNLRFDLHACRSGPWKLVFKMSGRNLQQSRGQATMAQLYNLQTDVGEQTDLSDNQPMIVERLTQELKALISAGTSRPLSGKSNDTDVRFNTTQRKRWAPRAI